MAFWSQNNVEPKRNFRFKVEITGLEETRFFGGLKQLQHHLSMFLKLNITSWIINIIFPVV